MDELDSDKIFEAVCGQSTCDAEVEHFRTSVRRDDDVAALQIAVGHAVGVRMCRRIGDLDAAPHHEVQRQSRRRDDFEQALALDILHRDEGLAVVHAGFINRADVGMVQLRRVLGLSAQPGVGVAITVRWDLQRHVAAELGVAGEIHLAHATSPQQPHDFIPADKTLMDVQRFERWCLDKAAGLRVSGEEAIDVRSQPGRVRIAGARLVEKRIALGRISLERLMKHFFDARPSLGVH